MRATISTVRTLTTHSDSAKHYARAQSTHVVALDNLFFILEPHAPLLAAAVLHASANPRRRFAVLADSRQGPGVGGCELGKSIDSSQFRASVPMPTRPSVRCTRRPPRSLDLVAAEGSQQARSQTDDALESSWYQTNVERAGALSPMMDGSNSSLQARSPCITAAALCFPAAKPTHMMPSLPILAHASMHS